MRCPVLRERAAARPRRIPSPWHSAVHMQILQQGLQLPSYHDSPRAQGAHELPPVQVQALHTGRWSVSSCSWPSYGLSDLHEKVRVYAKINVRAAGWLAEWPACQKLDCCSFLRQWDTVHVTNVALCTVVLQSGDQRPFLSTNWA